MVVDERVVDEDIVDETRDEDETVGADDPVDCGPVVGDEGIGVEELATVEEDEELEGCVTVE